MTATTTDLKSTIEAAWDNRDAIDPNDRSLKEAVEAAILRLDSGEERVAEKVGGEWQVNQWLKKAVLLSFRLNPMEPIAGGPGGAPWWDKVPSKFLAGARKASPMPASAPSPAPSSAAAPISRPARC